MQQAQVDMYEFDISGKLECIFRGRNCTYHRNSDANVPKFFELSTGIFER